MAVGSQLRSWFLVLAAFLLLGEATNVAPHVHASGTTCLACVLGADNQNANVDPLPVRQAGAAGAAPEPIVVTTVRAVVFRARPTPPNRPVMPLPTLGIFPPTPFLSEEEPGGVGSRAPPFSI